jgi:hypothetical protein
VAELNVYGVNTATRRGCLPPKWVLQPPTLARRRHPQEAANRSSLPYQTPVMPLPIGLRRNKKTRFEVGVAMPEPPFGQWYVSRVRACA